MSFNATIVTVKRIDYRSNFLNMYMSKNEAIDLLRNADLIEKSGTL